VAKAADEAAVEFESRVDATLQMTCELARALIGAHQAAMGLIVPGDWAHARKYFSLSDKYARWKDFRMPARGADFYKRDERHLKRLAELAALTLDALAKVRSLRVGEAAAFAPRETSASFVQIESV
jgi:hypothetical protein